MFVKASMLRAWILAAGLTLLSPIVALGQSTDDAPETPPLEAPAPIAPPISVITAPATPVIVNVPSPLEPPEILEGIWLTTDFPAISQNLGESVRFDLRLESRNLPPRRVAISVDGLPDGWKWRLDGGGRTVSAAYVGIDGSVPLTLRVTPPADASPGRYDFTIVGHASPDTLDLPITLDLGEARPARLTLEAKLPSLRGTPRAPFDFQVAARNDSTEDQVFNLLSEAPAGLTTVFTELHGGQELTSIPIRAGESKDLKVSVRLPQDAAAGLYAIAVRAVGPNSAAETKLVLDVAGQPALGIVGPEGRFSGDATAGKERAFNFTLRNGGSAPARDIKLEATAPAGWQVTLEPASVPVVEPGQELPLTVAIGPTEKAIAGDYVVSVRAAGEGVTTGADFRVTVLTSALWGIAGLGVIGAAVIVLAVAVTRYGRR